MSLDFKLTVDFITDCDSRSKKVHTLSSEIYRFPNTSLEPLSQGEFIVVGGDSHRIPKQDTDSVIIETVSTFSFVDLFSTATLDHQYCYQAGN